MAKIARKTQKIFGGNAANNGQFGSAAANTFVESNDPATIMALAAWGNGWNDATISGEKLPPLEEFQGIDFVNTYQLAYIMQEGVVEYDAGTTYFQFSVVKMPGTYELYGSMTDNNVGNPLTDATNWQFLQDMSASGSLSTVFVGGVTTGTPNSQISAVTGPYFRAYGNIISMTVGAGLTNTGALQVNIDGTGLVTVKKDGVSGLTDLVAGDWFTGESYNLYDNGTFYVVLNIALPMLGTMASQNANAVAITGGSIAVSMINSSGPITITSASVSAFAVGLNGAANPALLVDASTALSATGIAIKSAAAGSGSLIIATSSGANESITLSSKNANPSTLTLGNSSFDITIAGTSMIRAFGIDGLNFFVAPTGNTKTKFNYSVTGDDTIFNSFTENNMLVIGNQITNYSVASGTLPLSRSTVIGNQTFTGASAGFIMTDAATLALIGPPLAGNNMTFTNAHGLYIPASSVVTGTGLVTNAYGLTVHAPIGAANNYAAAFIGDIDCMGNSILNPRIINAKVIGGASTANFSVASNTALAIIPGTLNSVVAGGVYAFTATLNTTASTSGGVKVQMGGTCTATNYNATVFTYTISSVAVTVSTAYGTPDFASSTATADKFVISGTITVNAAGTFGIQFAQNTSNATASVVLAGATLVLNKIA